MPTPFTVRDQDRPGVDLGEWDENGNIRIPGDLTVGGEINGGVNDVDLPWLDPADYGVIPNTGADLSAAFQTMFDAIPAAGGSEIGGAYIQLPKGVFLVNTATAGVIMRLTGKANVRLAGTGAATRIRTSTVTADEILRVETCTNFKMENILFQVIGTSKIGKGVHYTTTTSVGSAHLGRFTNVDFSCNGAYRRVWDFMITSGSPIVYSAMAAFAAGDVGGRLMINTTSGAWVGAITAVATLSGTLAAAMTDTTGTTVTLNSALPGAPASGFTIQVETERMFVSAGGNTTSLTVTRGRGVDGIKTTHPLGAVVATYSATMDSNAAVTVTNAAAPGRIQAAGTAYIDVGLAIATDFPGSGSLDVANTVLLGCSASHCMVAGVQVGNGTSGNVLDHWAYGLSISECGYGVYLTAGSLSIHGGDFSTNVVDYRKFQPVSQEVLVSGIRTENPAMFYEMTGAATSGPQTKLSSIEIATFNAEDGVPVRHLNSGSLYCESMTVKSSTVSAGTVLFSVAGTASSPCYFTAINIGSTGGNSDLFSSITSPTAIKTVIGQFRLSTAGVVSTNTGASTEIGQRIRLNNGIAYTRTTVANVAYQVLISDNTIAYTSLSAARIITLPAQSASMPAGQTFVIKDESGSCGLVNTLTITPPSGTIDGAATLVLNSAYATATVYTDGSNWFTR